MNEWKEYKLGDITSRIGDGLHGTPKYDSDGAYYFINGNNILNGKIVLKEDTRKVNTKEYLVYAKPLSDRTILISINGTIGNVGLYNGEKCMLGKSACYVNLVDGVDRLFIYYSFVNYDFQEFLNNIATGTTIPNVPLKGLREYIIKLPPLPEQEQIAGILSSLDGKIDLLGRQNVTLEAMAETLFRQYFIESKKKDWKDGYLGDLVVIKYGKDHKHLSDGVIPVYGSGGLMRAAGKYLYNKESVLIPRKGTLNNVMYVDHPFWTVDTMFYTEMRRANIAKFVYHSLKELDLASMNVGSAVPSMTTEVLNNIPIMIPPQSIFGRFEMSVNLFYLKIGTNRQQIRTLTKLRDTLLPKLMNNEIKVNVL